MPSVRCYWETDSRYASVADVMREAPLNYKIFADNFFTSMPLLEKLKDKGIHYTGIVRPNRIIGVKLEQEKEMKKRGCGSMDQCVEKITNVVAVRWYDTKTVNMLSTYSGTEPNNIVKRYDGSKSTCLHVKQPAVIKLYNEK
ncbi:piggyBac transposable element-derived protein 3 [Biomphalaria glabrata]|nr:piggyBac transposable element-derived protein 3 [Biomphalaria glabrata]